MYKSWEGILIAAGKNSSWEGMAAGKGGMAAGKEWQLGRNINSSWKE